MLQFDVVQEFVDQARRLSTETELFRIMEQVTLDIGFHYFALINHVDLRCPTDHIIHLDNYPPSWSQHFIDNRLYTEDPILRASLTTHVGFAWTEVPKIIAMTRRQRSILERAAKHGLAAGFTVPVHIPGELNGSCSFATHKGRSPPSRNLLLAQLIGAFGFQAARRLKRIDGFLAQAPRQLTPRQRDCLLWAIRGKTDWEISRILGLSEETVSQHLDMARERYGVSRRLPLAVRAIFDGQINFLEAFAGQFPLKRE